MKKVIALLFIMCLPLMLAGCGKQKFELKNYMSEITYNYYQGENDIFNASVSVGQREIDYNVDGRHSANCDFSLVEVKFLNQKEDLKLQATISVNNKDYPLELEFVPLRNTYMGDLGFAIEDGSNVSIKIDEQTLQLKEVSKDFSIDSAQALSSASLQLIDEIASYYQNGQFLAEGYLKLLNQEGKDFSQLFWCFTLVGSDGVKFDVVINAYTGEVVGVNT